MFRKQLSIALLFTLTAIASTTSVALSKPKTPSGCINVHPVFFLCGSGSSSKIVVGGGFRFSKFDSTGRLIASKLYRNCRELAQDSTVPQPLRTQAVQVCQKHFSASPAITTQEKH
jgi:hypothetical protein